MMLRVHLVCGVSNWCIQMRLLAEIELRSYMLKFEKAFMSVYCYYNSLYLLSKGTYVAVSKLATYQVYQSNYLTT